MDRTRLLVFAAVLLCLPLLLAAFPSAEAEPPTVTRPGPGGIWHRVGAAEDLRSIARRYYGSARAWRTVQLANDIGMQPEPGRDIWIPALLPELLGEP